MIEIITHQVKMPSLDKRRFQWKPLDCNGNKWEVTDTENNQVVYTGNYQNAALAVHNLNKKHYDKK